MTPVLLRARKICFDVCSKKFNFWNINNRLYYSGRLLEHMLNLEASCDRRASHLLANFKVEVRWLAISCKSCNDQDNRVIVISLLNQIISNPLFMFPPGPSWAHLIRGGYWDDRSRDKVCPLSLVTSNSWSPPIGWKHHSRTWMDTFFIQLFSQV